MAELPPPPPTSKPVIDLPASLTAAITQETNKGKKIAAFYIDTTTHDKNKAQHFILNHIKRVGGKYYIVDVCTGDENAKRAQIKRNKRLENIPESIWADKDGLILKTMPGTFHKTTIPNPEDLLKKHKIDIFHMPNTYKY